MPANESQQRDADLERLTAQELMDALTPGAPAGDDDEGFDLGKFKDSVLGELNRRMGDKDLVKDIPGTGLIQLAKELLKQPADAPEHDGEDTRSIIDTLDALPPEHAKKLLQREIDRLSGDLARYTAKLEELK